MDVKDLKVFLAVSKYLNYTRAGEEVHLSQPSISVRIKQLEDELGVKLFEQFGKKIALTEAGRLLEPYAKRVVAAIGDARQAIEEFQGLERGKLRIGASTTPGIYLLPRVISRFKILYPKIELQIKITVIVVGHQLMIRPQSFNGPKRFEQMQINTLNCHMFYH
jgi:DNA-binding transcriptional LysR family regulator